VGPGPPNLAGFTTSLPTPEQVLSYSGRAPNWGPRVTLRSLKIENGVATADFSRELQAYGGGSLRVRLIRGQITQTLMQFPTVREVRIAIEGQTQAVLEP
jgi:spore germination protein GerM